MSKRRRGFPSEAQVKRGDRVVGGEKELIERLGRNDPCPCGSGRRFQAVLHERRPLSTARGVTTTAATDAARAAIVLLGALVIAACGSDSAGSDESGPGWIFRAAMVIVFWLLVAVAALVVTSFVIGAIAVALIHGYRHLRRSRV